MQKKEKRCNNPAKNRKKFIYHIRDAPFRKQNKRHVINVDYMP
jgi:hypothetical protein